MAQLAAVIRLELRKSFFNRRSFWIYLLALAPLLIFAGHAWDSQRSSGRLRDMANERPGVTADKVQQVKEGMPQEEVTALLGEAPSQRRVGPRRQQREEWVYSDGSTEFRIRMREGKVDNVRVDERCNFAEDTHIFAGVFQFFFVRLMVFFGCVFVFLNLFRGEMLDKSLHYYFLAPIRREVVVAGKFLAGLSATAVIFGGSVALQLLVFYWHFDANVLEEYLTNGHGWQHAFSYVGVTVLACLGYGSVFLAAGLWLKNPLIPAVAIQIWESINGVLPAVLRKFSIIFYLKSLSPVELPIDRGVPPPIALLAVNVEPVAPVLAVLGLLLLSTALLLVAARKSRSLEIHYGAE
jgi:hypothetical protein